MTELFHLKLLPKFPVTSGNLGALKMTCSILNFFPKFPQNYVNVTSGSLDALKVAIAKHGPVSVGIDASHKSLSFYSSGVYFEPTCGNTLDDLVIFFLKQHSIKMLIFFEILTIP